MDSGRVNGSEALAPEVGAR